MSRTLIFATVWFLTTSVLADAPKPPNFVVIVADDLGWNDVAYRGSPIKTPNIDRLSRDGVRLEQHYVAPVCSPTRTALMSGRFWSRFNVTTPTNDQCMPFGTVTLASALKSVGYQTALVGKWHLGSLPEQGPNHFGFDHSYGSLAGGCGPYDHHYKTGPFTNTWHRDERLIEEPGHITDLLTAEAVRWIDGRAAEKGSPFFLYVPFTAPHLPIKEPKRWEDFNSQIQDPALRLYGACISHMDDGVGQILGALQRNGLAADTLVVFFSDNGGNSNTPNADQLYPADDYPAMMIPASNTPLRGKKAEVYEGGIRVPAIAYWPDKLKAGTTVNVPLHVVDWMPTLTALAGYKPTGQDLKWDGRDAWRTIVDGEQTATDPVAAQRTLYWVAPNGKAAAVRRGDWKLIVTKKGNTTELFNLATDPNEQHDLAKQDTDRVAELRKAMTEVAARDGDAAVPHSGKTVKD